MLVAFAVPDALWTTLVGVLCAGRIARHHRAKAPRRGGSPGNTSFALGFLGLWGLHVPYRLPADFIRSGDGAFGMLLR